MSLIRIEKSPKHPETITKKQYEQQCQSHTCSGTIHSSMYDCDYSIITFPLISSGSLQWVKASENTNLHTKFLLQFLKQWEDSAMLLASNKQQHNEIAKKRKRKQGKTSCTEEDSREEQRPSGLTRSSPLTELLEKLQMQKFHKRIFHY